MLHRCAFWCVFVSCLAIASEVEAQVGFSGRMGDKAILVISGQVHLLNVGQTREGVKLISLEGNEAVVEFNGQRQGLNLGSSPSRFSGSAQAESSARKIILTAMDGGHFVAQGLVNGRNSISFLVDTGATFVTLSQQEATRLGLDLTHAPRVLSQTANGQVVAYRTTLESIRIQDVIIYNVDATVIPAPMPFSLLGNSFLTRFQMNRENDRLTLEKRL